MAENNALHYENVTPEQFVRLAALARENGIALEANQGSAEKLGAEVAWDFQPATGQLTLECRRAPFFFPPEAVLAQIDAMVRKSFS
jgi:hypothetical protein